MQMQIDLICRRLDLVISPIGKKNNLSMAFQRVITNLQFYSKHGHVSPSNKKNALRVRKQTVYNCINDFLAWGYVRKRGRNTIKKASTWIFDCRALTEARSDCIAKSTIIHRWNTRQVKQWVQHEVCMFRPTWTHLHIHTCMHAPLQVSLQCHKQIIDGTQLHMEKNYKNCETTRSRAEERVSRHNQSI